MSDAQELKQDVTKRLGVLDRIIRLVNTAQPRLAKLPGWSESDEMLLHQLGTDALLLRHNTRKAAFEEIDRANAPEVDANICPDCGGHGGQMGTAYNMDFVTCATCIGSGKKTVDTGSELTAGRETFARSMDEAHAQAVEAGTLVDESDAP